MSITAAYLRELALAYTQKHGQASTQEIMADAALVDNVDGDDESPTIRQLENGLNHGVVMQCRARVGWPGKAGGEGGGGVAKFIATGNRRDLPRPTQDEAEATATALNGMALARNDKGNNDAAPATTLDPEKIYAKWNSAGKNRKAAEAE